MTIKQKTAVVEIDGGKRIEVHRMRWKAHREFFKKFAALAGQLFAEMAKAAPIDPAKPQDPTAFVPAIMAKLPELVASSDELATLVGSASTDLKPDEFDELDGLLALRILDAAIAINCDDEVKNCLAEIGAKVAALVSAKTKTS